MKNLFCYILLMLMLTQMLSKVSILLSFQWNQEYIAQNLCENIDKPQLKCEGKCYLKKQLDKDEQKQNLPPSLKIKELTLFAISFDLMQIPTVFFEEKTATKSYFLTKKTKNFHLDLFRPPSV